MSTKYRGFFIVSVALFAMFVCTVFFTKSADAAPVEEPDSSGVFRKLNLVKPNDFRVYAKDGETIHVSIYPGYDEDTDFSKYDLCAQITILSGSSPSGSTITAPGNVDIRGIKSNGTAYTMSSPSTPTVSTCDSTGKPYREIHVSYTVAGNPVTSMDNAFIVRFYGDDAGDTATSGGDHIQGYQWRVAVNNSSQADEVAKPTSTATKHGRVWFVGNDSGLSIWQQNPQSALTSNTVNYSLQFVRKDGYRYAMRYLDYHGIWSDLYGGVYGVRPDNSNLPAYTSYGTDSNSAYRYTLLATNSNNLAYVFVDCDWNDVTAGVKCPSDISFIRSQPITNGGTAAFANTAGGTDRFISNTIATKESDLPTSNSGFRYTGYSTSLTDGTVTIPYYAMQTGYIHLDVTATIGSNPTTVLCSRDYFIDNADGSYGEIVWQLRQDAGCTSGSLRTASPPVLNTTTDTLTIRVQAIHLGEMHFLVADDEKRAGGVKVYSNDTTQDASGQNSRRSLIWYDPFSRNSAHVCGTMPSIFSASDASSTSGLKSSWYSMSSRLNVLDGTNATPDITTQDTTHGQASTKDRAGADSGDPADTTGVHGWNSTSGCDGSGSGGSNGHSNNDGTASTVSTWGNDRVIEDWTYAFKNPDYREIKIGGPDFTLQPQITVNPSPSVTVGQSVTATPSVHNNGTTTATNIDWHLYSIIVPANSSISTADISGTTLWGTTNPCVSTYASFDCNPAGNGTMATVTNNTTLTLSPSAPIDTSSLAVGTNICYLFVVSPYTRDGGDYYGVVRCTTVASSPYVAVIGGNVWSGGSTVSPYNGSADVTGANSIGAGFGSFGEYGVFATSTIDYFGSAGRVGAASTSHGVSGTRLTFGSAVSLGNFSNSHRIADLTARCGSLSGSITIHAETLTSASPRTPVCADTVTIDGDITYSTGGVSTFGQLPSLTVIANNILVSGSVSEIAGNFYAVNRFVTCSQGSTVGGTPDAAYAGVGGACTHALRINGTVTVANQAAGSLVLNRSSGGTTTNQPAEAIVMRPESFLTTFENSINTSMLTTVSETELPARY